MEFSPESATRMIGVILVPAVMVSTCALLLNGVLLRYRAVDDLLRTFNQALWGSTASSSDTNSAMVERVHHLEHLIPKLFRHHHLLHEVLVLIYGSILIFVLDMLAIAVSGSTAIAWISRSVLVIFLIGVGLLCWSLVLTCYELYAAHDFIQIELGRSCNWCGSKRSRKHDHLHSANFIHHHHLD